MSEISAVRGVATGTTIQLTLEGTLFLWPEGRVRDRSGGAGKHTPMKSFSMCRMSCAEYFIGGVDRGVCIGCRVVLGGAGADAGVCTERGLVSGGAGEEVGEEVGVKVEVSERSSISNAVLGRASGAMLVLSDGWG